MPHGERKRRQAALAGNRRRRFLTLAFERQIQIIEALVRIRGEHGGAQIVRQFALALDALEDRLLALRELPQQVDADLDVANHLFAQAARALLTVAGNERHRVALLEQPDDGFHLYLSDLEVLSDARTIQRGYIVHCEFHPVSEHGGKPPLRQLIVNPPPTIRRTEKQQVDKTGDLDGLL